MSLPVITSHSHVDFKPNLYSILSNFVQRQPQQVYLYGDDGPLTYQQVDNIALKLGQALQREIDPKRPLLGISLSSNTAVLQLVWACLASGICLAFLPAVPDPEQIAALMNQIGVQRLVTDVPELQQQPWAISFTALQQTAAGQDHEGMFKAIEPTAPAFLFQTSGTTGAAKWIQVTHGQFTTAIKTMREMGCLDHAAGQAVYITPPLSHSYGLSSLLEYSAMGAAVVLPAAQSTLGAVGDLLQARFNQVITAVEGVPHFYAQMARLLRRIKLPHLRHVGFGGGALDLAAVQQLQAVYPALSYSVRYGLTETPSVVSHKLFTPPYTENWHSSGKVLPIYTLRIVDEAGNSLPVGQPGEIHIQGSSLAWPFFGETAVTSFFATGDIGYLEADTQELHINGRQSAFLKVRGYRLSPEYLESIIASCPGVAECRVSGTETGILAEVVPAEAALRPQTVLTFLADKLPSYAIPETVLFVDVIPRTHSGKIIRH
jgi:acyl-coenzyme A synthetase/AMP-(fatty) acid ligase